MEFENKYLTLKDLEHIKNHKYVTTGYSKLDNLMNPFWKVSANWVTLFGLISLFMGVFLILFYDLTMEKELPPYIYVAFAVIVFLGQTFDAIDGKHARNTGKSSPLGQLMDHGCDAFSNSFICIMVCQTTKFGGTIYTVLIQSLVQLTFFACQWEENQTGIIKTHFNNLGVTEYQMLVMGLHLLPVAFGNFLSVRTYLPLGFTIGEIFAVLNILLSIKTCGELFYNNLKNDTNERIYEKIYPLFSFFILMASELLTLKLRIFKDYTIFILLISGFYFGFQTSKKKIEKLSIDNLVYFCLISLALVMDSVFAEVCLLTIAFAVIAYRYIEFIILVVSSLLNFLKIEF